MVHLCIPVENVLYEKFHGAEFLLFIGVKSAIEKDRLVFFGIYIGSGLETGANLGFTALTFAYKVGSSAFRANSTFFFVCFCGITRLKSAHGRPALRNRGYKGASQLIQYYENHINNRI